MGVVVERFQVGLKRRQLTFVALYRAMESYDQGDVLKGSPAELKMNVRFVQSIVPRNIRTCATFK